jgi:hypothetical protein
VAVCSLARQGVSRLIFGKKSVVPRTVRGLIAIWRSKQAVTVIFVF